MTRAPPFVVVSTFTGIASISLVSGLPLATTSGVVELMLLKGAAIVRFLGATVVVVNVDGVVVVYLLVVVLALVVVVSGRFVVVLEGFVVTRKGFVVVLLGGGFVILIGFVVVRVGFGLVTIVVVLGLLVAFVGAMLVLFSTAKLEAFCTDWNVVTFKGASVVTFFLTVVVGSLSLVVTGFDVVVFVTLKGGSLGGMIAKSILLSTIS